MTKTSIDDESHSYISNNEASIELSVVKGADVWVGATWFDDWLSGWWDWGAIVAAQVNHSKWSRLWYVRYWSNSDAIQWIWIRVTPNSSSPRSIFGKWDNELTEPKLYILWWKLCCA